MAQIKDIAILFFAAFVISCSLNPIVDVICDKYKKISRPAASGIVLSATLLIGFLFIVPIIVTGGVQISSFIETFPEKLEHAKTFIAGIPFLSETDMHNIDIGEFVSSTSDVTSNIVDKSIMFSKGIASFLIYFLAACIIIYYFMADKDTVKKGYLSLFPHNMKKRADDILESISQKVGGYVLAQVVTITSVGIIMCIGLAILGIDYAAILGLITAIFDLVPVVGPTVAIIIILIAVCKLGALKITLVILLFCFAQWAENNLVRPYIFGKLLDLHPLIIYFFLLVTAQYLGLIGVVFAPALAATFCVLLEELYIKNVN
jgi:predicted PurR-regulated permease PerM